MSSLHELCLNYPNLNIIKTDLNQDRLSQAYLFLGQEEVVWEALKAFVLLLQCSQGEKEACGECDSCLRIKKDFLWGASKVEPSGRANSIKLEDISTLQSKVATKPMGLAYHVCFIKDVQCFEKVAANAFLKVLEEPPPSTVWILSAPHQQVVLDTLASRCRKIILNADPESQIIKKYFEEDDLFCSGLLEVLAGESDLSLSSFVDKMYEYLEKDKEKNHKKYISMVINIFAVIIRNSYVYEKCDVSQIELVAPCLRSVSEKAANSWSVKTKEDILERSSNLKRDEFFNVNFKTGLSYLMSPLSEQAG
ncbi:hypothetical protein AB834_07235 [PVC group bacterium (ex Bugula neritina AB1)]|nr:hypothetical protein AB834_07235 [PVC group bacterium (ex Bugula neritina AB1)]